MRNMFSEILYEQACADERVHIVAADISPAGPMTAFSTNFPHRFLNVGVAEQVMIGICGGLALKGMRPFAYTIATFALYRPFEMIRCDLAYQKLPVTVVGIGAGVTYSQLGGTHNAMEDVAVASAVPNMGVIAPCDPAETRDVTRFLVQREDGGPVYLRIGKAGEPDLTKDAVESFRFGRVRTLRKSGGDVCVLSYGTITRMARDVADGLAAAGRPASLVTVPTLKPLDRDGLAEVLKSHSQVVVIEEHVPQGGLAAQVKQIAWDIGARCRLDCFTLQDKFIKCYGTHEDLLAAHGLETGAILAAVRAA